MNQKEQEKKKEQEQKLLRSVALQNAQSILLARRRAEEELRKAKANLELKNRELEQQKEWFEVTLSSIGDGVITTDITGNITFMNAVAEAMTGWERNQAYGLHLSTVFRIIDEQTREHATNLVDEVLRGGKLVTLASHTVLISKDGTETAIEDSAAPIRNTEGEIIGIVMVFHDVVEKRRAAEALLEESRALEILNMTGATITSQLEYEDIVKTVTDAATQLSGAEFGAFFYTRKDEYGKISPRNYVAGVDPGLLEDFAYPCTTPIFARTFEGKPVIRLADVSVEPGYEQWAPRDNKLKRQLGVRSYLAVPVVSRNRSVIGGLFFGHSAPGIFTERSERIVTGIAAHAAIAIDNARLHEEAQREIASRQKAEEALRGVDRRKDEFLALLAHELRNPLAPIRQAASLWKQENLTEEQLRWSHNVVERQSRHMALLLDDLLDISRIKHGSLRLRKDWTRLSSVVDAAIETASPLINARDHELTVELVPADLQLEADPVRLTQVIANLLNNAAKYTDPGGIIKLTATLANDTVEIKVADTGIGIAVELQPQVFEIFFQSTAPIDRIEGGLGLGLALVKGITSLHNGEVAVKSAGLGCGTEFTVRIPAGSGPWKTSDTTVTAAAEKLTRASTLQHVLIVDDNHDTADSLAMYLQLRGHEVATVYSGDEAILACERTSFDWIVMDIGMPNLNGYETARRIRAFPAGHSVKLVALTGWGQERDKQLAAEAGFNHHFTKPINPAGLADVIEVRKQ